VITQGQAVRPITPTAALSLQATRFPPELIQVFNDLIVKNFNNGIAIITMSEASLTIASRITRDVTNSAAHINGWLDIEETYRATGWDVSRSFCGHTGNTEECFLFKAPWYKP
jgi:hypothetical protein